MIVWGSIGALVFVVCVVWLRSRGSKKSIIRLDNPGIQYISGKEIHTVNMPTSRKMSSAQKRRRNAHFAAYVGLNGSGKSATMMWDTLADLNAGLPVLSTMAILSPIKAETVEEARSAWDALGLDIQPSDPLALPHPLWIPFVDFKQLIEFQNGVILMDEVQGVADGRQSAALPSQVANRLNILRRNNVILRWTTIDYSTPDKRIRDTTILVTYCKGFFPKYEEGKIWGTKQIFQIRSYKADEFENFTQARNRVSDKNRIKPVIRQWVRLKGALMPALSAYDSSLAVLTLGAHNDAGICMTCSGRRTVPQCSCPDHVARKKKARIASPASESEDVQSGLFSPDTGDGGAMREVADAGSVLSRRERRQRGEL